MRKKAFTLIELVIVIVIVGILSVLLFRTISQMLHANARIQQEKILAQELINIQTSLNNISEHYPYLDRESYKTTNFNNGIVSTLYLRNLSWDKIFIAGSGDCATECYLVAKEWNNSIPLTNPLFTKLSDVVFKIIPSQYYEKAQYETAFKRENISHPWFRLLGTLTNNLANEDKPKSSYLLQHFIELKLD